MREEVREELLEEVRKEMQEKPQEEVLCYRRSGKRCEERKATYKGRNGGDGAH